MIYERIYLDDEKRVYIDAYANTDRRLKPLDAMLVIPGGGYGCVCSDREGEPIALSFLSHGINSFSLNYRTGKDVVKYPDQLVDAAKAMAYVKENAEKYNINPDRVFAVGFSAGGHLCGTLATLHEEAEEILGLPKDTARPTGVVLSYPVVTALHNTHRGSFERLLAKPFDEITEEEKMHFSLEMNINKDTSPAFIWHTAEDKVVPPVGSIRLAEAYVRAGAKVELHLYPYGSHGLALSNDVTVAKGQQIQPKAEVWVKEAVEWMKTV